MMSSKAALLRIAIAFTLIHLFSPQKEDWLENVPFNKLPGDCIPQSCSDLEKNQLLLPSCNCEESCSRYGTCCIDSPYATLRPWNSFGNREKCSSIPGLHFGVFMVSSCNPRWRRSHVARALCERSTESQRDPFVKIPVTNTFSNITYKNYFCSLCNFDDRGGVLWSVSLQIFVDNPGRITENEREDILRRLEYNGNSNEWGIWNTTYENVTEFIPVEISGHIPFTVDHLVKRCNFVDENGLKSRCAITWRDEAVKRICQSYLSPIQVWLGEGSTGRVVEFRNPHCAVCNYVTNFEGASCARYISFGPSLSFTILLDVNPSDGDKVAQTNTCGNNEVHDPFFKKCRALVCALPGYVVKNGQCVRA